MDSTNIDESSFLKRFHTKLLDINDDCLDKIFDYFAYDDIISASQVCRRLEDRSQRAFKRRKLTLAIHCDQKDDAKLLIRHIAPALEKIEIYFCDDLAKDQEVIDLITEYCIHNLIEIRLQSMNKNIKFEKPLSQIQSLVLSFCDSIGNFNISKWFPIVNSVTYHYTNYLRKMMKQTVPTMQTLSINGNISHVETVFMLLSNPQIKNLSLNFASQGFVMLQRGIFTDIDLSLPELETLTVIVHRGYNFEIPYRPLHFKNLKALRIENYINYPLFGLINCLAVSADSLERLELRFSDSVGDTQCYKCITKYKKLRELVLMPVRSPLSADNIVMLANELPLLERIEQFIDFTNVIPWKDMEVQNFIHVDRKLMELTFVFVHQKPVSNKSFNFFLSQFAGSKWIVNHSVRQSTKIFDTGGIGGQVQKEYVVKITRKTKDNKITKSRY